MKRFVFNFVVISLAWAIGCGAAIRDAIALEIREQPLQSTILDVDNTLRRTEYIFQNSSDSLDNKTVKVCVTINEQLIDLYKISVTQANTTKQIFVNVSLNQESNCFSIMITIPEALQSCVTAPNFSGDSQITQSRCATRPTSVSLIAEYVVNNKITSRDSGWFVVSSERFEKLNEAEQAARAAGTGNAQIKGHVVPIDGNGPFRVALTNPSTSLGDAAQKLTTMMTMPSRPVDRRGNTLSVVLWRQYPIPSR